MCFGGLALKGGAGILSGWILSELSLPTQDLRLGLSLVGATNLKSLLATVDIILITYTFPTLLLAHTKD